MAMSFLAWFNCSALAPAGTRDPCKSLSYSLCGSLAPTKMGPIHTYLRYFPRPLEGSKINKFRGANIQHGNHTVLYTSNLSRESSHCLPPLPKVTIWGDGCVNEPDYGHHFINYAYIILAQCIL